MIPHIPTADRLAALDMRTGKRLIALAAFLPAVFAVLVIPAHAAAATGTPGATYLGFRVPHAPSNTAPDNPALVTRAISATFIVARDGRSLRGVFLAVGSRCSNGRTYSASFTARRLPLRRGGRFSATLGEDLSGAAFTASGRATLSGRFIRAGRRARLRITARSVGNDGTVCRSGRRGLLVGRIGSPPTPNFTG